MKRREVESGGRPRASGLRPKEATPEPPKEASLLLSFQLENANFDVARAATTIWGGVAPSVSRAEQWVEIPPLSPPKCTPNVHLLRMQRCQNPPRFGQGGRYRYPALGSVVGKGGCGPCGAASPRGWCAHVPGGCHKMLWRRASRENGVETWVGLSVVACVGNGRAIPGRCCAGLHGVCTWAFRIGWGKETDGCGCCGLL